ncbi:MAG TPA: hypothetical protein PLQ09_10505 [Prolixibacteraceae bacterium]|nr:hypothetical protein [Prolixibacteraceae bacterium]
MKSVKVILLVSFILGLLLFQVKFVAENDNLNMNADISISKQANAETNPGGIYKENPKAKSCGFHYTETWEYWGYDEWGWIVLLGTDTWIDNVAQQPKYTGPYIRSEFHSSSTEIVGMEIICEAGKRSCTPGIVCP